MPKNSDPPPKQDVAQALLLRGSAFVYLDPRREGVAVPEHLRKQAQLVLQIGLDLAVPIPDLTVDDDGIFGTLSFNRSPFPCTIPWSAVFGLVSDDSMGVVWQEDLPDEIAAEVEVATRRAEEKARRPALRAIEGGASGEGDAVSVTEAAASGGRDRSDDEGSTERASADEPGERPRPHLRLVE